MTNNPTAKKSKLANQFQQESLDFAKLTVDATIAAENLIKSSRFNKGANWMVLATVDTKNRLNSMNWAKMRLIDNLQGIVEIANGAPFSCLEFSTKTLASIKKHKIN